MKINRDFIATNSIDRGNPSYRKYRGLVDAAVTCCTEQIQKEKTLDLYLLTVAS